MKKHLILSLMALLGICSFTSCEDDDYTMNFPTWKGFKISTNTVGVGDTLRIYADLDKGGRYLYKVKYSWGLVVDTISEKGEIAPMELTYNIQSTSSRPIHCNDQPKAFFVIPQNVVPGKAQHRFNFRVDYEHAAVGTPTPTTSEPHTGYLGGTFRYEVLSPLFSRTSNSFTTELTIK